MSDQRTQLLRIGELVADTWEVRSKIGEGGMGQVFEAFDRFLQRPVALKVARAAEHPLRKEAQALAALRHPSLVTVFAGGVHRELEFVVMERILGVDLAEYIERQMRAGRMLSVAEALDLLAPLAEGLAAVHRAGVAHRDVKPENVLMAPGGRVVLSDFGVFMPEFDIARTAVASGSPAYMAPETIRRDVGPGGGFLVDVYAFGVLAFEVLCLELPYVATNSADFYVAHLSAPIPSLRAKRRDVPTGLESLVTACLAKDATERPQSMADVAFQLRTFSASLREAEQSPMSERLATSRNSAVMRAAIKRGE
ncbi:MAG: serine/threonine-protein kinase [Polyangiales bacterium]